MQASPEGFNPLLFTSLYLLVRFQVSARIPASMFSWLKNLPVVLLNDEENWLVLKEHIPSPE